VVNALVITTGGQVEDSESDFNVKTYKSECSENFNMNVEELSNDEELQPGSESGKATFEMEEALQQCPCIANLTSKSNHQPVPYAIAKEKQNIAIRSTQKRTFAAINSYDYNPGNCGK